MTTHRGALPTLTEVIDVSSDPRVAATAASALPPESMPLEAPAVAQADTAAALTKQVLETLRPRIDALLQTRLQAALAPQLSRLADELAHSLRGELAGPMQALVAQAVNEVLARQRKS